MIALPTARIATEQNYTTMPIKQGTTLYSIHDFFYKKLGSGHRTRSFLTSHEILSILVLKVS